MLSKGTACNLKTNFYLFRPNSLTRHDRGLLLNVNSIHVLVDINPCYNGGLFWYVDKNRSRLANRLISRPEPIPVIKSYQESFWSRPVRAIYSVITLQLFFFIYKTHILAHENTTRFHFLNELTEFWPRKNNCTSDSRLVDFYLFFSTTEHY